MTTSRVSSADFTTTGQHCAGPGAASPHTPLACSMSAIRLVPVSLAYAAILVIVAAIVGALDPHVQETVVSRMSTNLHNLASGRLDTLIGSAFVTGGGMGVWLPGLVSLLASGELAWRSGRLVVVFAVGHVGATLIVAAGLAVAVRIGLLPVSLMGADDVGVSYGAAAVLGALTATLPRRMRPAWVGWWLGTALLTASTLDFTAVGHVVALTLGMGLSVLLDHGPHRTSRSWALLAVGVGFGYLLLTASSLAPASGGLAGVLIALLAQHIRRRWSAARPPMPTGGGSHPNLAGQILGSGSTASNRPGDFSDHRADLPQTTRSTRPKGRGSVSSITRFEMRPRGLGHVRRRLGSLSRGDDLDTSSICPLLKSSSR